jgi:hypothetical protein
MGGAAGGELVAIERENIGPERDLIHVGPHCVVTQDAPKHPQRFTQRVSRRLLVALAPQEPDDMLARSGAARAACEIHEQCEVFPPQELSRRGRAVDRDAGGPEDTGVYATHLVHGGTIIDAARRSGK